jgi:glutathione synthase/RimK-type ligase-like ATP-grasp enzyme
VLKIPDGSFSRGVFKIETTDAFLSKANLLLEKSYVLVAQEFMPTPYDWRIGVLDGQPLFACKYFMSRGHWQIYNHKSNNKVDSGDFETVPVAEVPTHVLDAAIRASLSVGNGLYGVDIKEIDGRAFIIEVNDNPNIDAGIEDKIIGADLYNRLMASFHQRILLARVRTQI